MPDEEDRSSLFRALDALVNHRRARRQTHSCNPSTRPLLPRNWAPTSIFEVHLAAVGAKTSRIEIGTAVIDTRYEIPFYMAEDAVPPKAALSKQQDQIVATNTGERQKSVSAVYQNVIAAPFMALVNLAG